MKERIKTGVLLGICVAVLFLIDSFFLNTLIFLAILYFGFKEGARLWGVQGECLSLLSLGFFVLGVFTTPLLAGLLAIISVASYLAYKKALSLKPLLPFIYPALPIFMLYGLYSEYGLGYLAWCLLCVIASDSGAYFVGKKFGRSPFSASSPNKTLEGVVGGVLCGTLVGLVFASWLVDSLGFALVVSFLICAFGVFGDLFESYLKREAGVKDSGSLFPGHGGMLDRIDGYLFGVIALMWAMSW